ncbi:hypothetical protein [uncultured Methylobacterium sp.]|uniref:hypothetical protein n=1 Tax=uncultured Methylobacterium sp. TaxID=157278 RepID=UPI0035C9F312
MADPPDANELRVVIRSADVPADADDLRLVPAEVFRKVFNSFLAALKVAELVQRREMIHPQRSQVFISDLKMGSNQFALATRTQAVHLLRQCAESVYRSDYSIADRYTPIAHKLVEIGKGFRSDFSVRAEFVSTEVPIDHFFVEQTRRLENALRSVKQQRKPSYFAGSMINSFVGRLGNIDYLGPAWKGILLLDGTAKQIECVFDRARGEDAYNPFGNKRVSVSGVAIYTGDSPLPQRIEIKSIEEIPFAEQFRDIRGSMIGSDFASWGFDADRLN